MSRRRRLKPLALLAGAVLLSSGLAGCDAEEQAHEVHLAKGHYAGKPMAKLDARQISALERRAASENY